MRNLHWKYIYRYSGNTMVYLLSVLYYIIIYKYGIRIPKEKDDKFKFSSIGIERHNIRYVCKSVQYSC